MINVLKRIAADNSIRDNYPVVKTLDEAREIARESFQSTQKPKRKRVIFTSRMIFHERWNPHLLG